MRFNSILILSLMLFIKCNGQYVPVVPTNERVSVNQRKIIFEGNSLFNLGPNTSSVQNGHYIPSTVYAGLTGRIFAYTSLAISARTQTQINTDVSTAIIPIVRPNDIIVLWEGTNDINLNALTAAQAYSNLTTYASTVRALGAKLVVCTVIARDQVGDPGDLMTRIDSYNALIRASSGTFDVICDLAADASFDTRADASSSDYTADKLHLATTGQAKVVALLITSINTLP